MYTKYTVTLMSVETSAICCKV